MSTFFCWTRVGSPPRVRGRVHNDRLQIGADGITPARAGKSWTPDGWMCSRKDHPRACGEECDVDAYHKMPFGSPPRVRGRVYLLNTCSNCRITPARAGKRGAGSLHGQPAEDHPRACGEELRIFAPGRKVKGSPPRVRGRGAPDQGAGRGHGSPPRVRGRVGDRAGPHLILGITPARAGKRISGFLPAAGQWDHPRACGEERKVNPPVGKKKGSPPRVRGRGPTGLPLMTPGGITPARAGKSSSTLVTKFCA